MKFRIDGVEVDVSNEVAQLVEKERAAAKVALDAAKAGADKLTARADAAEADLKKVQAELKAAPAKIRSEISARFELEAQAKKVMGSDAKFDGLSDRDVRIKAIQSVDEDVKFDGKSDEYVSYRFDHTVETAGERTDESALEEALRGTKDLPKTDGVASAREAYLKALTTAYKAPASN